ncbi:hypothetical protein TAL182_CH01109 [Rhizobium sp. TAL182]|uniref:hypothetical protein n=1 Tax=Rhizobium sp. TAL182 TaxID=2020313 RepID=UPI000A21160B|nr:hypothetical protein [Rhizobium sp. TAL182]ARO22922.1 hypothetical protein TAL182_CH01109 [Rhizobium sp. TAL182]
MSDHQTPTPDFSPAMLKGFLRARVKMQFYMAAYPNSPLKATPDQEHREARLRGELRKLSGVSAKDFNRAWAGLGIEVDARLKLWRALGISPTAHGVRLIGTDQQEWMAHRRADDAA